MTSEKSSNCSGRGRVTADGMYVLRQMVVKRLEVQGSMALGFVDLEKAFDTVPREMVVATLRWMGVPEAEVRMAEGKYEKEGQEWWSRLSGLHTWVDKFG